MAPRRWKTGGRFIDDCAAEDSTGGGSDEVSSDSEQDKNCSDFEDLYNFCNASEEDDEGDEGDDRSPFPPGFHPYDYRDFYPYEFDDDEVVILTGPLRRIV